MNEPVDSVEIPHFSIVCGGPLFQLFRKTHLSGDSLEHPQRRVVVISCFAWLPLLILSAFAGNTVSDAVRVPFLYDIDAYVRFLIALPALIATESLVHARIGPAIQQFVTRGIVLAQDLPALRSRLILPYASATPLLWSWVCSFSFTRPGTGSGGVESRWRTRRGTPV